MSTSASCFKLFSGSKLLCHQQNHFNFGGFNFSCMFSANVVTFTFTIILFTPHTHWMKLSENPKQSLAIYVWFKKKAYFLFTITPIRWNFLKTLYKAGLSMYDLKRRHTFCLQSHPFDETLWKPYEAWLSMYDLDRSHHVRNKCSFKPSDNAIKRVLIISRY